MRPLLVVASWLPVLALAAMLTLIVRAYWDTGEWPYLTTHWEFVDGEVFVDRGPHDHGRYEVHHLTAGLVCGVAMLSAALYLPMTAFIGVHPRFRQKLCFY